MIERLLNYLEKRPRAVVAAALTFVLALSGVSGLCFYVLTIVVESERHQAMTELQQAKERFEDQSKLLRDRARLNSEQISRLADSLTPMLKAQADDVRKLKDEFAARQKDKTAPILYAKLAQVEYQLMELESRLSAEKAIAEVPTPNVWIPGDDWLKSYLLRWLTKWSSLVALISGLFLYGVLRSTRKKA